MQLAELIQTLGVPEIHILNFRKCIQEGTNAVVEDKEFFLSQLAQRLSASKSLCI